jgi:hypothetical protein
MHRVLPNDNDSEHTDGGKLHVVSHDRDKPKLLPIPGAMS